MIINKVWAMPNHLTFTIKPIKELLSKYVKDNTVIVDAFANTSKYGTITNDLNPEYPTTYNLDALSFFKKLDTGIADLILFDPPYSISQASEMYKNFGKDKLEVSVSNMGYWAACKNEMKRICKVGGSVICFGWNSNGLGKGRNFEMIEILLVSHGGSKNDTICTVEVKKDILTELTMFN